MRGIARAIGRVGRFLISMQALGGSARVEVWNMLTDLMEARLDVERAMQVTIQTFRDQGQSVKAWILEKWLRSLLDGRFPEEVALWVPATEAMVIQGYGRVDARPSVRGGCEDRGRAGEAEIRALERARDAGGAGGRDRDLAVDGGWVFHPGYGGDRARRRDGIRGPGCSPRRRSG